jgi:two-component system sensor histidine kinase PhcS
MIAAAGQDITLRLADAYREFILGLRLRQAKIGYLLAMGLVPAAISLDVFVYPELLRPIFKSRMLCDLALLPCFISLFTSFGPRHIRWLSNAWLVAPLLVICWMIYASEGSDSPYYAGLNLVMLSACLLTTYGARDAIIFCAVVLATYCTACFLHTVAPPAHPLHKSLLKDGSLLFNNIYFLFATAVICVASCHFSALRRFEDFRLHHELDDNNRQLAETLKKLQDTEVQLVQSEKMNALGKLSAGLLHEINNPLNFTFMALRGADREAGDNADLKETLADIHQGMSRIRSVISDLRVFAYPTKLNDAEPFLLAEAVTTALRLTAHELGDIPIEQSGVDGVRVLGSKTQIVHVLMNLLMNSAHALKDKPLGRAPRITLECTPKDERLAITVGDNGTGVAAADMPRLFEPFFTTKGPGKGTGLGLSICHTIISNHGGEISITSEHGLWARVTFDMQLAKEPARPS